MEVTFSERLTMQQKLESINTNYSLEGNFNLENVNVLGKEITRNR